MTERGALQDRVAAWFEGLAPAHLDRLAAELAEAVARDGLTVLRGDGRAEPIPVVMTPEPVGRADLDQLGRDAGQVLSATIKLARFSLTPEGAPIAQRLYTAFTPLELEAMRLRPEGLESVATARVDCFFDAHDQGRALELNATIPAMQGYADILAHHWIQLVARERGRADLVPALLAAAGSNTADLLASLLEHYRRAGGREPIPSILIVSRRGDAQLGELLHYERRFSEAGHRALHVWVDEVVVGSDGRMRARGERFDLLYRHIFARRIEIDSVLGRLLLDPGPNVVLNPVVSPLETKGMFALLHRALEETELAGAIGLDADELAAVRRRIPWTRVLGHEPTTVPGGARVSDLVAWASEHPTALVLKKSWDYGGKSVVLGPDAPAWRASLDEAVRDRDAWVVQEYVPARAVRHLLVEREGEGEDGGRFVARWREPFVDVSAYTSHGIRAIPRGGACRASNSKIVNILGGGGLTPLLTDEVLTALFP